MGSITIRPRDANAALPRRYRPLKAISNIDFDRDPPSGTHGLEVRRFQCAFVNCPQQVLKPTPPT